MERTLGRPSVTGRVVQDTLQHPVTGHDVGMKFILAHGQRQFACHAMAIEYKRLCWQSRDAVEFQVGKVALQEILNAQVDGALVIGEQAVLLAIAL